MEMQESMVLTKSQKQNEIMSNLDNVIVNMTPAQKEQALTLASSLDYKNVTSIHAYGSELNQALCRSNDNLLKTVRSNSSIEVVDYITEIVSKLDGFDDVLNRYNGKDQGWFKSILYSLPFVKKAVTSIETVMNSYNTIDDNVNKICDKIANSKIVALRDNSTLNEMYSANEQYTAKLNDLIIAAKLKKAEIDDQIMTGDVESSEKIRMENYSHKLGKKIADMVASKFLVEVNQMEICEMLSNNDAIVLNADNITYQVIPIWKKQLQTAIMVKNQGASIEAQALITDTTNKLITKTSAELKANAIKVAKASEESIIKVETIQATTQDLISTFKEVKEIYRKGDEEHAHFEETINSFANQLKNTLIDK